MKTPTFSTKFSGSVVLRDKTEFPLSEVFERNPDICDIYGFRCDAHPHIVSYAKGWAMWDANREQWNLVRLGLGAYGDTHLANR